MSGANDDTVILMKIVVDDGLDCPPMVQEALELVEQLWPASVGDYVTMDWDTWNKVRRTLLAVPELWLEAQHGAR